MFRTIAFLIFVTATSSALAFVFDDTERWSRTATNGFGLQRGDPTTLTWSVVPDGTQIVPRRESESSMASNLRTTLDSVFGFELGWRPLFEDAFNRWGELSGLSYVFEPRDDGRTISESGFATGSRGVRGDIRLAGHELPAGFLAYNYFPDNGDMVLGTNAIDSDINVDFFRNLISHEHGHGIGLQHEVSSDSRLLMESGISTLFVGPQFDDILGLHRGYGDALEKNGGNDTIATAYDLGILTPSNRLVIGSDGETTRVLPTELDFVSIDGATDVDFYAFGVPTKVTTTITLKPKGPTYSQSAEGSPVTFDASSQSDLSLELYRPDGRSILASSRTAPLGQAESIVDLVLDEPGLYFLRVAGSEDAPQMYELQIGKILDAAAGDFNADGNLDVEDIEALTMAVLQESTDLNFDLTGDGNVNRDDRHFWVNDIKQTFFGDSDLDGIFDSSDIVRVFQSAQYEDDIPMNSTWATGDWNGDRDFTTGDLVIAFQDGGFEQGARPSVSIPEPTSLRLLCGTMVLALVRFRRNSWRSRSHLRFAGK